MNPPQPANTLRRQLRGKERVIGYLDYSDPNAWRMRFDAKKGKWCVVNNAHEAGRK